MAELSIFTGRENIGTIPNVKYDASQDLKDVMSEIVASNSLQIQYTNALNMVLAPMERQVPRKNGSPLPVKIHNVKFTDGGVQTSAKEFRPYMDKFDMTKSVGMNVMNFDYDDETILESRNNGINLDAEALESLTAVRGLYTEKYLPFSRLKAVITGTSRIATIPTVDAGTTGMAGYKRSFGFARGEDYADFLTVTDGVTARNHYRTIVGATLASTDITNSIDLIEDTNMYSGKGVIVLGHPRTIQNLAFIANAPENKDIAFFGEITEMFGASFKKIPGFHKDFLIFLDAGYIDQSGTPLMVRGVEVDEEQRGLGLLMKDDIKAFKSVIDMNGSKARIFPEEWYMTYRLSGLILDTKAGRGDASGEMQTGAGSSTVALEAWVSGMEGYFKHSE